MNSNSINITITGDFCPTGRVEELCLTNKYNDIYGDILPILHNSDLSITNLECPLTENEHPISKLGPNLIANPECIELLKLAEFGAVTLANNHIMDQGDSGMDRTISICDAANIKTVGAGVNIEDAEKPLYLNIKDQLVAIISCAENEFSIATDMHSGACHLDPVRIYNVIKQAKEKTNTILIIVHGGNEFHDIPSQRMMDTYRFFAGLGVTAVIGHHTHCPSGYEYIDGVPIFYSLGNFLFDRPQNPKKDWDKGLLVNLQITNGKVDSFDLHPFHQGRKDMSIELMKDNDKTGFLENINSINDILADKNKLKNAWQSFLLEKEMEYLPPLLTMGRLERFLLKRGFYFGQRIKNKRLLYLLNLIQCEAHRDVSIDILKKWINKGTE